MLQELLVIALVGEVDDVRIRGCCLPGSFSAFVLIQVPGLISKKKMLRKYLEYQFEGVSNYSARSTQMPFSSQESMNRAGKRRDCSSGKCIEPPKVLLAYETVSTKHLEQQTGAFFLSLKCGS